jgi:hypothetical protein
MLIAKEDALENRQQTESTIRRGLLVLVLFFLQIHLLSSCSKRDRVDGLVSISSPCVLAAEPSRHKDEEIKVTAYITSTKEGAFIWGDDCKNSGIVVHFSEALARDAQLQETLLKHGMSPVPAKATLIGRFRYRRFSSLKALIFGARTFEAEQVLDLQVSPTAEAFPATMWLRFVPAAGGPHLSSGCPISRRDVGETSISADNFHPSAHNGGGNTT